VTEGTPTVLPIFSVPFCVVDVADPAPLNAGLAALLTAGGDAHPVRRINPLLAQGQDDLAASTDPLVRELMNAMARGIVSVAGGINDFSQEQWNSFTFQARAWSSIVEPDGAIAATHHPLFAWCAIYCIAAPGLLAARSDSGQLRLYESRLGTVFQDASTAVMKVPFRRGHYNWRPVAGRMAVFPAWLSHELALNRSDERLLLVTMLARFAAPGETRFASA
jgi:Putative 2OG-Fe(II) oxygenase